MKFSVNSSSNISSIPADAGEIHFSRPVKKSIVEKLLKKCRIKKVSFSSSTAKRISSKVKKLLQEKKVELIEEKNSGRPLSTDPKKISEIVELHRDFRPYREIEKTLGIPKSTAHYLIKYADRNKVKQGKQVVYL
ncbi:MAG: hypothetical protein J4224_02580 [Candidatus Diapherotrites archaeon]|uniref:Uncharacterized protein n=1 Tax=Candidatus Iainarchaeum sp. TaxID=3101447 RepID=A0A7J4IVT5_9ARCH|nr:MAG: hypothetical protein QT03_C0001G1369 [archaeon GW2011_AR10]MBS3059289.1 hypothetical protein [Candidatus Diapherotrites archaeon]HIH07827.1 hypothetical protein [Candidatus Diapherotrites archaeon]